MGAVAYLRPVESHKDSEPPDPGGTPIVCPECDGEQFIVREFGDERRLFCASCGCEIEVSPDAGPSD